MDGKALRFINEPNIQDKAVMVEVLRAVYESADRDLKTRPEKVKELLGGIPKEDKDFYTFYGVITFNIFNQFVKDMIEDLKGSKDDDIMDRYSVVQ